MISGLVGSEEMDCKRWPEKFAFEYVIPYCSIVIIWTDRYCYYLH